jgi:ferritin-like metal-binding protein YciE
MAEDTKHALLRYLNDAYAAEVGGMASLKDLAALATDPDLKQVVTDHLTQTQSQADRLQARILALGGDKSEPKGILDQVVAKASSLVNAFHSAEDKQTQDTIKAYSLEHFEVGTYTSLKAYADSVGDTETAQLAETIMGEEQMAGERLLRLIPKLATLPLQTGAVTGAAA